METTSPHAASPGWCLCSPKAGTSRGEEREWSEGQGFSSLFQTLAEKHWIHFSKDQSSRQIAPPTITATHSNIVTIVAPGDHGKDPLKFMKSSVTFSKPSWITHLGHQVQISVEAPPWPTSVGSPTVVGHAPLGFPCLVTGCWTRHATEACHRWPGWVLFIPEFPQDVEAVVDSSQLSHFLYCYPTSFSGSDLSLVLRLCICLQIAQCDKGLSNSQNLSCRNIFSLVFPEKKKRHQSKL